MSSRASDSHEWSPEWPRLAEYAEASLGRIAMPLGGIGTGTVSLGGRGDLRDWEIMNRPAKGFTPCSPPGSYLYAPHIAVRVQAEGEAPVVLLAEGPLADDEYESANGTAVPNFGLPRFRSSTFSVAYPLAQVALHDDDVPAAVRLEAFNPLVPGDAEASGLPVAVFRIVFRNPTRRRLRVAACMSVPNFIGMDGSLTKRNAQGAMIPFGAQDNRNRLRDGCGLRGIFMESGGVDPEASAWGTMALAVAATRGATRRTDWRRGSWGGSLREYWTDFAEDGRLFEPDVRRDNGMPFASVAETMSLAPGAERRVTFLLTWHFPNRPTWTPKGDPFAAVPDPADRIGNEYTERFDDAWDALEQIAPRLKKLERETVAFVEAVTGSDLPSVVTEAALCNLSVLRSQTCFRTPDGKFWGWEGAFDHIGSCYGNCTHVWSYDQATPLLFGALARNMRETEFLHAVDGTGRMSFRVTLPLDRAREMRVAAADGQTGCVMALHREWMHSGDDAWLERLWPHAKRAVAFAWIPGGWDADRDGVMEGCQHNTLDVEYYGPNAAMTFRYVGALRAGAAMARHLGDEAFADTCESLAERGTEWVEEHLFNGEYYEHEIRPPRRPDDVADGLAEHGVPSGDPFAQLGPACFIDQLGGQTLARLCGLESFVRPDHARAALKAILRYNRHPNLHRHVCHTRAYASGEESAVVMASHPRGEPPSPILHFSEAMTGFEYFLAVELLRNGMEAEALRVVRSIRDRYDGRKRNPFDEAECGRHYARSLASWGVVPSWIGFTCSAVDESVRIDRPRAGTFFWSDGAAWGVVHLDERKSAWNVTLEVRRGRLSCREIIVEDRRLRLERRRVVRAGKPLDVMVVD